METVRKPYQGVTNIVRFNWHFYVLSAMLILLLLFAIYYIPEKYVIFIHVVCILIAFTIIVSLAVSYYIYDLSNLYSFNWLPISINSSDELVNIHAGFDETSEILHILFPGTKWTVLDFYNPHTHTEVSIKRARKAYPPFPSTQIIDTAVLPIANHSIDHIFVTLAAHEIRQSQERIAFFLELKRILKPQGRIVVTEHLRDLPNFLAFNIGFFHFLSKSSWIHTFKHADLKIMQEIKNTPFISTFILGNK